MSAVGLEMVSGRCRRDFTQKKRQSHENIVVETQEEFQKCSNICEVEDVWSTEKQVVAKCCSPP